MATNRKIEPYSADILRRLPAHVMHKAKIEIASSGSFTYSEAMALSWDDLFNFSPDDIYGSEHTGNDILIHLKSGRYYSYQEYAQRLGQGLMKPQLKNSEE